MGLTLNCNQWSGSAGSTNFEMTHAEKEAKR